LHFLKQLLQSTVLLISASKMDSSKTLEMVFLRWDLWNYYWVDGINNFYSNQLYPISNYMHQYKFQFI
jgi:hypothetical protein